MEICTHVTTSFQIILSIARLYSLTRAITPNISLMVSFISHWGVFSCFEMMNWEPILQAASPVFVQHPLMVVGVWRSVRQRKVLLWIVTRYENELFVDRVSACERLITVREAWKEAFTQSFMKFTLGNECWNLIIGRNFIIYWLDVRNYEIFKKKIITYLAYIKYNYVS